MDRRHVVVTGGAGGIGRAFAQRFAADGCRVTLVGREEGRLAEVAASLRQAGAAAIGQEACDLGDPQSVQACFERLGPLQVLVNAAGAIPGRSLLDSTPQEWHGSWSDKVLGTIEATRLACRAMREGGGGVVLSIIGTAGVRPNPKTILTVTANAALIAFTQALGAESVDWNVRVVGINPGLTETPRTAGLLRAVAAGKDVGAYGPVVRNLPFGRMASVAELAECGAFLASPAAAYISGTVVDVDAGARWRT